MTAKRSGHGMRFARVILMSSAFRAMRNGGTDLSFSGLNKSLLYKSRVYGYQPQPGSTLQAGDWLDSSSVLESRGKGKTAKLVLRRYSVRWGVGLALIGAIVFMLAMQSQPEYVHTTHVAHVFSSSPKAYTK